MRQYLGKLGLHLSMDNFFPDERAVNNRAEAALNQTGN